MSNDEREATSERGGRAGPPPVAHLPALSVDGQGIAEVESLQSQTPQGFSLAPYRRRPQRGARPPKVIVAGGLDEARAYVPPTAVPDSSVPRTDFDIDEDAPRVLIHEPLPPSSRSGMREVTWLPLHEPRVGPTSSRRHVSVPPPSSSRRAIPPPPSSRRAMPVSMPPSSRRPMSVPPGSERSLGVALPERSFIDTLESERPTVLASKVPRPDVRWIGVIAGVAGTVMLTTWLIGSALVRPNELPPPMASRGIAASLEDHLAPAQAEPAPPAAQPEPEPEEAPQALEVPARVAPPAPRPSAPPPRPSPTPRTPITTSSPEPSTRTLDLPNYE
ncbi:hypothetical protein [Polyangium aurulentum]|uniref:hypothetical protein n=1 Tax=Polyangium aurulentum TaxID=2567896 RepID=UPI0010AE502B|nr:hypothetical protein [Polyangium aurulentum]UQA60347.1 hypothetical protein E8A73_007700 [Polyangium aurulentum]